MKWKALLGLKLSIKITSSKYILILYLRLLVTDISARVEHSAAVHYKEDAELLALNARTENVGSVLFQKATFMCASSQNRRWWCWWWKLADKVTCGELIWFFLLLALATTSLLTMAWQASLLDRTVCSRGELRVCMRWPAADRASPQEMVWVCHREAELSTKTWRKPQSRKIHFSIRRKNTRKYGCNTQSA